MAIPKHKYNMDYIDDKEVFKAVMYATKLLKWGKRAPDAIRIAAYTYQVDMSEVAHYLGQRGGRK